MRHPDETEPLLLQSFTYEHRDEVLLTLRREIDRCGGWLLGHRAVSATATELHIEVQTHDLVEVYAAVLVAGLELTRAAHLLLAAHCAQEHYLRRVCTTGTGLLSRAILTLRLEVIFLPDPLNNADLFHQLAPQTARA